MPLVEIWRHEFLNKLEEREEFIDPVWRECTQLEDEFLFEIFAKAVRQSPLCLAYVDPLT